MSDLLSAWHLRPVGGEPNIQVSLLSESDFVGLTLTTYILINIIAQYLNVNVNTKY